MRWVFFSHSLTLWLDYKRKCIFFEVAFNFQFSLSSRKMTKRITENNSSHSIRNGQPYLRRWQQKEYKINFSRNKYDKPRKSDKWSQGRSRWPFNKQVYVYYHHRFVRYFRSTFSSVAVFRSFFVHRILIFIWFFSFYASHLTTGFFLFLFVRHRHEVQLKMAIWSTSFPLSSVSLSSPAPQAYTYIA